MALIKFILNLLNTEYHSDSYLDCIFEPTIGCPPKAGRPACMHSYGHFIASLTGSQAQRS